MEKKKAPAFSNEQSPLYVTPPTTHPIPVPLVVVRFFASRQILSAISWSTRRYVATHQSEI